MKAEKDLNNFNKKSPSLPSNPHPSHQPYSQSSPSLVKRTLPAPLFRHRVSTLRSENRKGTFPTPVRGNTIIYRTLTFPA